MLVTLASDTGQFFQVDDAETQAREQQLGLGIVLALGFSLLVHFFLALLVLPALSIDKLSFNERQALEVSLAKRTPELPVVEPEKTEKKVKIETPPISETRAEQTFLPEDPTKEESAPPLFPTDPETSRSDTQAERIFNPRLRQQFYNNKPRQRNYEIQEHVEILGSRYYGLGKGKCLREMDNYGITDRDSEAFLMFNVRNVDCPGTGNESEGEAMIRGLRAALNGD